MQFIIWTRMHK